MKIRNLFLILLAQTLGWTGISAQSIDAEDAAARARDFFQRQQSTTVGVHKAQAMVKPVLAYTATTANTPDFYVFNRAEDLPGFVIVNADATSTTEILGYSEMSTFDYDTAPDNFKWWLQQYQTNGVSKAPAKAAAQRHDVDYLCKTKWNQDSPYWNSIPYTGTAHYVTGCAATSMAQVMKFYEYPDKGVGDHSYVSESLGNRFYANFANTTYDWANMLEDYSNGYLTQQANAVATLMYHCGVAQDMDYNISNSRGSAAGTGRNGQAMIEYFKYDKSMQYADRFYYSDDAWADMLYNEVVNERPILYSGTTVGSSGHSFVCDGYKSLDGTFHFNWGWGGSYDGYYTLVGKDAINPYGSGIGGGAVGEGFTEGQVALVNIKKDEGGEYIKVLGVKGEFLFWKENGNPITNYNLNLKGGSQTFNYSYAPQNPSLYETSFIAGIELRHDITGECLYIPYYQYDDILSTGSYFPVPWEMSFSTKNLSLYNGVYELRPAFEIDGEWHTGLYGAENTIPTLTVTGGLDAQSVELPFTISASEVEVGKTVTITPHNAFHGNIVYTSSASDVASVSETGIVTGLKEGHATITATSEATPEFLATTKTFDIDVIAHVMHNVEVALDKNLLMVDETANISITKAYDGEVTYTVVPDGVVSISADGVVTALAEGDAVITVNVAGNDDFLPVTKKFEVTVSNNLANTGTFEFADYPTVGDNNIVTDDLTVSLPVVNNASTTLTDVFVYYQFKSERAGTGYRSIPSGYKATLTIDFNDFLSQMERGKTYTVYFYRDNRLSVPMNVPSLTFYYAPENSDIGNVSRLIKEAKDNAEIKPQLIKSLVSKVLEK